MADLTLPEVITRFRGNEARIDEFANGNAAGYYITADGKKVETLPSVVSRLAAAIAAASATADTLKGTGGAKLIGFGTVTVDAALTTQAKGIADNAKAIADLDKAKLAKDGGTMTGPLTLAGAPTDPLHAVPKGWAETLIGTYWKPAVGDLLTTARGAPDATWIPDGANYLQASYAPLFAKLGLLQTDNTTNTTAWSQATTAVIPGCNSGYQPFLAFGGSTLITWDGGNPGKVLRSTDGGATFTAITAPLTDTLVALATDGKGTWIGGSGGARNTAHLMRSTDDGLTWQSITLPGATSWYCLGSATDGKGNWIVGGNFSGCYTSSDNGATWVAVAAAKTVNYNLRSICYATGTTWYAAAGSYVLKSTDNGANWTASAAMVFFGSTFNVTAVSYFGGILAASGYSSNSSSTYNGVALGVDNVSWRFSGSLGSSAAVGPLVMGREGIGLVATYTGNCWRFSGLALDPTQVSGVAAFTVASAYVGTPTWPCSVATDGLSTWIVASSSSNGMWKVGPAYDIKTTFRVPKSLAQPAPFATFVKAK